MPDSKIETICYTIFDGGKTIKETLSTALAILTCAICANAKNVEVDNFKALADGKTNNLAAIQKAIDECSASGGGEVIFSENGGTYLSGGPIILKNNVTLRIPRNAILKAIPLKPQQKALFTLRARKT